MLVGVSVLRGWPLGRKWVVCTYSERQEAEAEDHADVA
jgi:hypothetical protein